jgi:hypothetical protein
MVLTDSLISGPIPKSYRLAAVDLVIAYALPSPGIRVTVYLPWQERVSKISSLQNEDVQIRTLLAFCPAKAAVGAADA